MRRPVLSSLGRLSLGVLPMSLLTGCPPDEKPTPEPEVCDPAAENADAPALVPGAPQAATAEGFLDLPVGLPLSGYTSRCKCFGNDGAVDRRDSAYTYSFNPSAGVQTRIPLKVFWLNNGDQDLVLVKTDLIYSYDGMVVDLSAMLSEQTGRDLSGKVVIATNHSHGSYGDFSDQVTFYLGSDRFNYEIYLRILETAAATAMEAYTSLQPAKIGVGYAKDWDPADQVYHDRRGDNDDLQFFPDIPAGSYKDPNLTLMRIDSLDDQPLGVLFNFGVHGTTLGGDSAMISGDTPGHIERMLQERFDQPVVVALFQGAAGDASPSNEGKGYGAMERTGQIAADAIHDLWTQTPTSADPIRLETVSRSVKQTHDDIYITRGGTTDLRYTPFTEGLEPDNIVYADDGSLLTPVDEFNVAYGGAFCGEDPPYLPGFAPSTAFPYASCVNVDQMIRVIDGFFDLTDEESALPLTESTRAYVTASRLGPFPIREADGSTTTDEFFIGFFPGETTAMYTEQFRRRAAAELGYRHSMAVGYAQDHEGYLLIPEDWLQGGYEIDINIWGPLQGEHIMERLLDMAAEELSTDVAEHHDPCGIYQIPDYGANTLPGIVPETAPEAGTIITEQPDWLYSPLYSLEELEAGTRADLTWQPQVQRVQGIVQVAWIGGDPGVDFPLVTLQQQAGDGSWSDVLQPSGRPIEGGPDILVAYTPDPLYTYDDPQTHYWYAAWQVIGPDDGRLALPLGNYRLHVEGQTYDGANTSWPWDTAPYSVDTEPFEVLPAAISLQQSGADLLAWIPDHPRGYRMLARARGAGEGAMLDAHAATVSIQYADRTEEVEVSGQESGGATLLTGLDLSGALSVTVTDLYGNTGTLALQ